MMWSSQTYTFDRVVRIFFTAILLAVVVYLAYVLRHVLLPFCVGCLIAYFIEPCVRWNMRVLKIKRHTFGVILTVVEALIVVGVICLALIPIIDREINELGAMLHTYLETDHSALSGLLGKIHNFVHTHFDFRSIMQEIERINVGETVDGIWHTLTGGLDKIIGVLSWLIVIVYVIFILLDFDKYTRGVKQYIPNKYKPQVAAVVSDLSFTMKTYFRKQAMISLIVGCCYGIGFTIVGIPMAVVIGMLNVILFMIPYMVYVSIIPVALMCLFKSAETGTNFWIILLECGAVYVFVEVFNDVFLTPKIMGKALGLNPAIILLSIFIWGTLLGVLGMIIALPVTTILLKWTKIWLANWRDKVDAS